MGHPEARCVLGYSRVTPPRSVSFEDFCQRVLALFEGGRFNATYKYAVLIGLLDVLSEQVGPHGEMPDVVRTRDLARAVLELYWPHARPFDIPRFDEAGDKLPPISNVLRQNKGGQAEIISDIAKFAAEVGGDVTAPLGVARRRSPERFERLVRAVEYKLIEMPIGKLQLIGNVYDAFIYELDWDPTRPPSPAQVKGDDFDGVLRLRPQVASHLLRAAPLVRPLVQREWALAVGAYNAGLVSDDLDEFLFGAARVSLQPVRAGLRELAGSWCFYCRRLVSADREAQIDHFLPWARRVDDGLGNLVFAHGSCNNAKRAYLAADDHLEHWVARLQDSDYSSGLAAIAAEKGWDYLPESTLGAARGIYLALHDGYPLWESAKVFVPADRDRLSNILSVTL